MSRYRRGKQGWRNERIGSSGYGGYLTNGDLVLPAGGLLLLGVLLLVALAPMVFGPLLVALMVGVPLGIMLKRTIEKERA